MKLWPHQQDAVAFASERDGTMFDIPMGLGKTATAIECLRVWKSETVLVLCPKAVCRSWEKQLAVHAEGEFDAIILGPFPCRYSNGVRHALKKSGSAASRIGEINEAMATARLKRVPFVLVVNYDSARTAKFAAWCIARLWGAIIADECHKLKSPWGATSKFAAKLKATHKLGLTGTVMPHSPLDVWAQYRFISPLMFGRSHAGFRSTYAVMGGYGGKQVLAFRNLDNLRARMAVATFSIADDNVLGLPGTMDETIEVELGPKGRSVYQQLESELSAQIDEGEITASNALAKLTRLQQITAGFIPLDGDDHLTRVDSAKLEALTEILGDTDEPVVVFGRWRGDMDNVRQVCEKLGEPHSELSGQANDLPEWETGAGGRRILGVQIQAGGLGIELTRARLCVFASTGFNLGDYLQARKRVHRPGQTLPVTYYHLVARETIDPVIVKAIAKREDLIESTIGELRRSYATND